MIQQGFRLKDTTDKLGGIQTLIDINTLDDIAIIDQYLIKMSQLYNQIYDIIINNEINKVKNYKTNSLVI